MTVLDASRLRLIVPQRSGSSAARQAQILDGMETILTSTMKSHGIDTPLRKAHFLAQIAYESDGFCTTEDYDIGLAYEQRYDLGNTQTGDGPLFKGRGLIRIAGRAAYGEFSTWLGLNLVASPQLVSEPPNYLLLSCAFWTRHSLNALADRDDLTSITRTVSGGSNWLDDRRTYLAKALTLVL